MAYNKGSMKISIEELLKNSFVISINNERYKQFVKYFTEYKLNTPLPRLIQGAVFRNISGVDNCSISHYTIVKLAMSLNLPFVCIFEDDAYPCINVKNKLEMYLEHIPDDTECILLGNIGIMHDNDKEKTDYYIPVKREVGSHAYILFKSQYQTYVDVCEKLMFRTFKNLTYNGNYIADHILTEHMNVIAPKENLFVQFVKDDIECLHKGTSTFSYEYIREKEQQNFINPLKQTTQNASICIYTIATNIYNIYIPKFLNTLVNFLPTYKKKVVILTDSETQYKQDCIEIEQHYLEHKPWPYITMRKFHYIQSYKSSSDGYVYCAFFNANIWFRTVQYDNWIETDKITATYHYDSLQKPHSKLKMFMNNPYAQANAIIWPKKLETKFVNEIVNCLEHDYIQKNTFPKEYDETVFNLWIALNKDKVEYKNFEIYTHCEYKGRNRVRN